MPETSRRLKWVRETNLSPDGTETDSFVALDGEVEVGIVKLVPAPPGVEWTWSLWLTHPGPAFKRPTNGRTQTRGGAVRQLLESWQAFRENYGIED